MTAAPPSTVSVDPPPGAGLDKLSVIVLSEEFERVHYALVLVSAAAAVGRPTTLFFSNQAVRALRRPDQAGIPGWHAMRGAGGEDASDIDDRLRARGVAGFEELLAACVDLGARMIVCEMGLRGMGMDATELRSDVPVEIAGVVTLLGDASAHGAMLVL
jgi:peroxiredoxin family protein